MANLPIYSPKAPPAIGPYSQAIQSSGFLFISGQLPINALRDEMIQDIGKATEQCIQNISHILKESGCDLKNIAKVTLYITKMKYFEKINVVYAAHFSEPYPARAVVEVSALPKGAPIEMDAIAVLQNR